MKITESQLRRIVMEEILKEGPSYEKGINRDKKVIVDTLYGMKSTPKTKKFKNMDAYEKWADSDDASNYTIQRVYNEMRTRSPDGDKLAQAIALVAIMDSQENPFSMELEKLNSILQDLLDAQDIKSSTWISSRN